MKSKKLLVLLIAGAMLASTLTACSTSPTQGEDVPPATQVVTEAVTDSKGEEVTEENGEVVTEVVTDKNGDAVTEVVSTTAASTTKAGSSTTAKGKTTSTTKASATDKNGTTAPVGTTAPTGTTTPTGTTAPNVPTKPNQKPSSPSTTEATTEEEIVETAIPIVLEKNRMASCKSPNVSIATGEVIIDKAGDYVITQNTGKEAWHGQIIIKLKNTEKASFRFENVHISNDTKNIIQILDSSIKSNRSFLEAEAATDSELDNAIQEVADNDMAPNVSISFPTGTSSTFETKANAFTGVIYNESKLTIKGNGSASITSKVNANNCICSTKSITMKNVTLSLATAQNTTTDSLAKTSGSAKGIFSYSKVTVESGALIIKSNGDAIRCDRFYMQSGTANLQSSACDALDTDDSIIISGGTVDAKAYEKYSFKVRRVNNTEKHLEEGGSAKGLVRAGKGDCFKINGGKVTGESKRITSLSSKYQSDKKGSSQASVTAKIIKANAGTADAAGESKVPAIIKIGNWASLKPCTKFLYSSSGVEKGKQYSVKANGNSSEGITWVGNAGVALIKNSTNQ